MDLEVRYLTKKLVKEAHALFGYTAGDKFTFETNITDNGRFQTFLREQYSMLFPSSPFPSIPEAWAGA